MPTFYHSVQSQAQVVSWIYRECVEAIHPALRSYFEQGLPPEEIIFRAARDILSLLRDKPGYLRAYFENHRDLTPRSRPTSSSSATTTSPSSPSPSSAGRLGRGLR